jgi:hypothetical protein
VFDAPLDRLQRAFDAILGTEPRLTELAHSQEGRRRILEQRSAGLGLPDRITVELVEVGDGLSTLAMHSAARFGFADLGVNRGRLRRWLAALRQALERPHGVGSPRAGG